MSQIDVLLKLNMLLAERKQQALGKVITQVLATFIITDITDDFGKKRKLDRACCGSLTVKLLEIGGHTYPIEGVFVNWDEHNNDTPMLRTEMENDHLVIHVYDELTGVSNELFVNPSTINT